VGWIVELCKVAVDGSGGGFGWMDGWMDGRARSTAAVVLIQVVYAISDCLKGKGPMKIA
jgi:hypothetical protein